MKSIRTIVMAIVAVVALASCSNKTDEVYAKIEKFNQENPTLQTDKVTEAVTLMAEFMDATASEVSSLAMSSESENEYYERANSLYDTNYPAAQELRLKIRDSYLNQEQKDILIDASDKLNKKIRKAKWYK